MGKGRGLLRKGIIIRLMILYYCIIVLFMEKEGRSSERVNKGEWINEGGFLVGVTVHF